MGKRGVAARPAIERFAGKYEADADGCWLWTAMVNSRGYAQIGVTLSPGVTVTRYAHRVAYEATHGPIPDGLVVDHICNVRRCVNPDHLQLLTSQENIDRSQHPMILRRLEDRCVRGHDLSDPAVVYIRPDNGRRACRKCYRVRYEQRRDAIKSEARKSSKKKRKGKAA